LIGYGFGKVFLLQFNGRFSELSYYLKPLGSFLPGELMSRFMGQADYYQFFTGVAEVVGGLLLLFRRTTLLGALISVGVMSNVLMMNYTYGFGVGLYSMELLLKGVLLILVDRRRFANFFFLNRSALPF
jgi:uncharacterized membrane protein YphA (DoxX/SURF4 family)